MGENLARPMVFLSYARAEEAQVAKLTAALEQSGFDVWRDTEIHGGALFAKSIEASLRKCDSVVVVWSRVSVTSDWVLDEAAHGRDQRKLVPVSLDGTGPPLGFRQYQSVDLSRWNGATDSAEIASLVRGIVAVTDRPAPATAAIPRDSRKMAAILAADVVDYSRLMGADEAGTLAALKARRAIFEEVVREFDGHELGCVGDSLMAAFGSSVNAVSCALTIQDRVGSENASLPATHRMQLRVGVNLGDVIEEKGSAFGDAVNVAARLQALARPGGLLISGQVYDQVHLRVPARYIAAGMREMKNISEPVRTFDVLPAAPPGIAGRIAEVFARIASRRVRRIAAVVVTVVAALTLGQLWREVPVPGTGRQLGELLQPEEPAPASNSIAVLPFVNLSGDPGNDYLADGVTEELRAMLARNLKLQVMAQTSSALFRERKEDAPTIAARLGVAYLLDGSVRRSGDVMRITADLVDGDTGFSRWSQMFDRGFNNIFAVQREIADTVAGELVTRVAGGNESPGQAAAATTASGGTTSIQAYDAYLRGRALYDLSADEASERAALAQFDVAIDIDPGYAAAHAARARSLTAIANQYGKLDELASLYDAAIASAQRAIALAPDLADAHSTLGFTLFQGRLDARAALAPFERSRELGAGEAAVLARYAQYSARTGRQREASEAMERALVLDKLNPLIHRAAGSTEYAARRYADSIPHLRQALAMNPKMSRAHAAIGDALLMLGKPVEARAEYLVEPVGDFRLAGLAIVERRLGRGAAAEAALAQLVADHGDRVLYQQGQVLAQWGRPEAAVAALRRALALGDSGLIYARNDPFLDPLREDREFADLLNRLGFD
ncbi:MAG: TIR domain-containing protein [Gammaproteobacteria bacterium]